MTVEEILRLELPNNLPGFESYKPLNLMNRPSVSKDLLADKSLKKAGVLALLVAGDNPYFLLTERNAYKGVHSAQVSFPGGKREKFDKDLLDTATRETYEEIGLSADDYKIVGSLSPLYIPPSHFYVQSYLAVCKTVDDLRLDEREVKRLIKFPLSMLMADGNLESRSFEKDGLRFPIKGWAFDGVFIWGATACMLMEIRAILLAS